MLVLTNIVVFRNDYRCKGALVYFNFIVIRIDESRNFVLLKFLRDEFLKFNDNCCGTTNKACLGWNL